MYCSHRILISLLLVSLREILKLIYYFISQHFNTMLIEIIKNYNRNIDIFLYYKQTCTSIGWKIELTKHYLLFIGNPK